MAKQLTIRGVPNEVGDRLERLSRARGQSVNATVLEILAQSFGVDARRRHLERYVGWEADDVASFQASLDAQRLIDDDAWR